MNGDCFMSTKLLFVLMVFRYHNNFDDKEVACGKEICITYCINNNNNNNNNIIIIYSCSKHHCSSLPANVV